MIFEKIRERLITDKRIGRTSLEAFCEILKDAEAEYNNGWIPCSERLPEEHDSIFVKHKDTEKWDNAMFGKISDVVNVVVFDGKEKSVVTHAHTKDGVWECDLLRFNKSYTITHWQPLPRAPKGE